MVLFHPILRAPASNDQRSQTAIGTVGRPTATPYSQNREAAGGICEGATRGLPSPENRGSDASLTGKMPPPMDLPIEDPSSFMPLAPFEMGTCCSRNELPKYGECPVGVHVSYDSRCQ